MTVDRGTRFSTPDGGFVQVVDYLGGDDAICQAARKSYGAGTKSVSDDETLIRYLMRHRHTTPFEFCELVLHIRVPMDTWRQWIRHRTASVDEYSTRFSVAIDEAAVTLPGEWRFQSGVNKQGSSEAFLPLEEGEHLSQQEANLQQLAREVYGERLHLNVAREQARKDLPLSTFTEAYWKIDLHNLLHFLSLRMDHHAQLEIRRYANIIGNEIVAQWVPLTWRAFCDYRLNAMTLSALELRLLRGLINKDDSTTITAVKALSNKRERIEAGEKLTWLLGRSITALSE